MRLGAITKTRTISLHLTHTRNLNITIDFNIQNQNFKFTAEDCQIGIVSCFPCFIDFSCFATVICIGKTSEMDKQEKHETIKN